MWVISDRGRLQAVGVLRCPLDDLGIERRKRGGGSRQDDEISVAHPPGCYGRRGAPERHAPARHPGMEFFLLELSHEMRVESRLQHVRTGLSSCSRAGGRIDIFFRVACFFFRHGVVFFQDVGSWGKGVAFSCFSSSDCPPRSSAAAAAVSHDASAVHPPRPRCPPCPPTREHLLPRFPIPPRTPLPLPPSPWIDLPRFRHLN